MRHRELLPAIAICSAALTAFVWLTASLGTGGVLPSIDVWIATWMRDHAVPSVTYAMIAISFLGAPSTLTAITAVICAVLVGKRNYHRLVALLILVLGGNLLNYGLKALIHRDRPSFEDPLLTLPSYSFPSGHALASTVFYGFAITCVLAIVPRQNRAVAAAGIAMIGLVCLSRVYLGVHYLSDVLGGVLEGIAWSILVLATLRGNIEIRRYSWQVSAGTFEANGSEHFERSANGWRRQSE